MRSLTPIASVLPILLLAACGGSDGLNKADYLKQAESVCTKANADAKALVSPTDPAGIVTYVNSLVTIADTATASLRGLSAPEADRSEIDSKLLTPLEAQLAEARSYAEKMAAAVKAGDNKAIGALIGDPPVQTKADTAWMASYGFKECVSAAKTGS
jgi:hypothetical protein